MRQLKLPLFLLLASISLTGCFRTREDVMREQQETEVKQSLQESVQTYSEQIAELQAGQSQLAGRVDEQEHKLRLSQNEHNAKSEAQQKDFAAKQQDNEARIKALEDNQKALFDEIKSLRESKLQELQAPTPSSRGGKNKTKPVGYDEIEKLMEQKKYAAAVEPLHRYLKENPKGKNHNKANFLLGEALYHTADYSNAILAFSEVQDKSPDTANGRKSTLRIAESFKKLGKNKEARTFAQLLVEKFPTSDEAKRAQKLLK